MEKVHIWPDDRSYNGQMTKAQMAKGSPGRMSSVESSSISAPFCLLQQVHSTHTRLVIWYYLPVSSSNLRFYCLETVGYFRWHLLLVPKRAWWRNWIVTKRLGFPLRLQVTRGQHGSWPASAYLLSNSHGRWPLRPSAGMEWWVI